MNLMRYKGAVLTIAAMVLMMGAEFAIAQQTWGGIGNNTAESAEGASNLANYIAITVGAFFVVIGLIMIANKRKNQQEGMGGAITLVVLGGFLAAWQSIAVINNNSTLGTEADSRPEFLNTN